MTRLPAICLAALAFAAAGPITRGTRAAPWVAVPLAVSVAPTAREVQVPQNDGWVTDQANLLSADKERELEALMESYQKGSGHDIALLTLPSLDGQPIERVGLEVGRAWKLGGTGEGGAKNDGAVLIVAQAERKLRIEVGRGLEGTLTDAVCGRIIRDIIAPRFKQGDFEGGIEAGLHALHAAAGGDYGPLDEARPEHDGAGAILPIAMFLLFLFLANKNRGAGPGGRGLRRAGVPWILMSGAGHSGGGGFGGGGFGGFGGGGGFSGGGASGGW